MQRATGQLLQHLKLSLREQGVHHRPARVVLLSTREGEGKTQLAEVLIGQLRAAGERVLWLRPASDGMPMEEAADAPTHPDDQFFTVNHTFFEKKTEADLLTGMKQQTNTTEYEYIFTEIPPVLANTYPADYLASTDLSLFIARANRTWNRADARALSTLHRVLGRPCNLVLNGVRPDDLENALGEVPKRRSVLRRWMKKMATLNFSRSGK
jgi:hypothetical protein